MSDLRLHVACIAIQLKASWLDVCKKWTRPLPAGARTNFLRTLSKIVDPAASAAAEAFRFSEPHIIQQFRGTSTPRETPNHPRITAPAARGPRRIVGPSPFGKPPHRTPRVKRSTCVQSRRGGAVSGGAAGVRSARSGRLTVRRSIAERRRVRRGGNRCIACCGPASSSPR